MKKLFTAIIGIMLLLCCAAFSSTAASNSYEREGNNSYTKANSIQFGSPIIGTINDSSDEDYYKITTPADGKVSMVFQHKYNNDKTYFWYVRVYILSNDELIELSYNSICSSDKESVELPAIGAKSGTCYYIEIKGYNCSGIEYQIQTSFSKTPFYEKERDDSYPTATSILLNNTYSGNVNSSSDVDYYKITTPTDGKVSLVFKHKYNNDKSYFWYVRVYILSDDELMELSYNSIHSSDKESIELPAIGAKSGACYYIEIKGYNCYSIEYQLKTSFSIPAPSSLKPSSIKTTSMKVAWSKVPHATGYVLYFCNPKTGDYTKIATINSNSYKVTGLKAGTVYRYAVKAYKTVNGTTFYSNYSPLLITATKPETVQNLSVASTAKRTVKITFDKAKGANGYVVYYATSQNGKYKKLGTTTKTTYTNKKLTSGTTYYFKVRAFTKAGSEKVFAAYSPIKSVRVK